MICPEGACMLGRAECCRECDKKETCDEYCPENVCKHIKEAE